MAAYTCLLLRRHLVATVYATTSTRCSASYSTVSLATEKRLPSTSSSPPQPQPQPPEQIHHHETHNFLSLLQSCFSTTLFPKFHTQFVRNCYFLEPHLSFKFLSQAILVFPREILYIRRIFDQIAEPNSYHYNVMIRLFSKSELFDHGLVLYKVMREKSVVSDALTLSYCMKCCVKRSGLIEGMQIHRRVLGDGHLRDRVLMSSLIELYSGCGQREDACKVLDDMPVRDTIAYNALISCLLSNKRTRDSLAVFDSMMSLGIECRPDVVSCLLLLQACAHLGALDFGVRVWDYVEKHGYEGHMNLNNAVITMYMNCGAVDEAYKVFERMPVKNLITWTTMISGFGMNGYGKDAVKFFTDMQEMGIAPDEMTLTAVLYACSHSGLLDEGFRLFNNMNTKFGIRPNIHHYGCAVDILGRLGLLRDAYDLILSMPIKPDAKIWRTLLGSCRIFGNSYIAEQAIEHIVELKAQETGDYVLLLNTYSSNRKWDKVKELRTFMKENKIMTTPGCSTIELKGMVHEFVPNDVSHPCKDAIYATVHEILQQLKIAGYVPQLSSELHDLNATEKETALCYHSEKLAVAFGVLSTPPGTTIRVANSVRICVDCHHFAKIFSAAYNRKLIIRDRNRIHLFREGTCTCSDCW